MGGYTLLCGLVWKSNLLGALAAGGIYPLVTRALALLWPQESSVRLRACQPKHKPASVVHQTRPYTNSRCQSLGIRSVPGIGLVIYMHFLSESVRLCLKWLARGLRWCGRSRTQNQVCSDSRDQFLFQVMFPSIECWRHARPRSRHVYTNNFLSFSWQH